MSSFILSYKCRKRAMVLCPASSAPYTSLQNPDLGHALCVFERLKTPRRQAGVEPHLNINACLTLH